MHKLLEIFLSWREENKEYLRARPNRVLLQRKLFKAGIDVNLEEVSELKRLARQYDQEQKNSHHYETQITKQAERISLDVTTAKNVWVKSKPDENGISASFLCKNPLFNEQEEESINNIDFESLFESVTPRVFEKKLIKNQTSLFDRLVFTDVHVGMDTGNVDTTLYGLKWDKSILNQRLDTMIDWTIAHQKSNTLFINDLGDFLDGYNGLTTRGGHKLPQNMSNVEAFEEGFKFKLKLIESLLPHYEKIIMVNICNDNHSGSFAYILNSALKTYCNKLYEEVEIINQAKFIDNYVIENNCFVLTHGKDDTSMKFGFKAKADHGVVAKIYSYLSNQNLLNKGYCEIEFGKGDSHLYLLDDASSDIFGYYNYPAFSPSSNWVQLNFNKGRSGFVHFNYYENNKTINSYLF
jgi:hypothetical protein